jgi:CRISPR-associated protein Cpf1
MSSKFFVAWHTFGGKILDNLNDGKPKSKQRKKLPDFVDLQSVKDALDKQEDVPVSNLLKNVDDKKSEGDHWKSFLFVLCSEFQSLIEQHDEVANDLEQVNQYQKSDDEQVALIQNFANVAQGIFRMTNYLALRKKGISEEIPNSHAIHDEVEKYLDGDEGEGVKSCLINNYYNALRNFITKKPWIEEKMVLSFENPQLLGGWPKSQETVKGGVILRKQDQAGEYTYYLCIIKNGENLFDNKSLYNNEKSNNSVWQKMEYMQLQKPYQMLPKNLITPFLIKETKKFTNSDKKEQKKQIEELKMNDAKFFANVGDRWQAIDGGDLIKRKVEQDEGIEWKAIYRQKNGVKKLEKMGINPQDSFLESYIKGEHVGDDVNANFLHAYFDFLKDAIQKYYSKEFDFPETKDFSTTQPFYEWAEKNIYDINFVGIKDGCIDEISKNQNIYLFQIYSKDFELDPEIGKNLYGNEFKPKEEWRKEKGFKKGKDNRDTILFQLLFDEKNLKNKDGVVYKLSGGAKVFYRPASKDLKKKNIRTNDGKEKEVEGTPNFAHLL